MNKSSFIKLDIINNIGILSLNNPPQNIINDPDFLDLVEFDDWFNENKLKGLIIIGEGRHFSNGGNLENIYKFTEDETTLKNKINKGSMVLAFIENLSIPTIACIKGACFGGGLEIALSCHIKICSDNALFSFPESDHRLMPGLNGTLRLPKLIGLTKSLEVILSGEIINAEKALEFGMIDYIVDSKNIFDFSMNLMEKMTKDRDIEVITSIVRSINNSKKMKLEDAMEEEMKMFCKLAVKESKRIKSIKN